MKRILALILSLIMVMSLAACGSSTTEPNVSENVGNVTETETPTETPDETETSTPETSTPAVEETTEPVESDTIEKAEGEKGLPIPEPPFAYEITTEEQDGIERFILTATCTDDEFTNYMKTCYGADSEYRMTENGTTEEGDETLMYMKYGNEDSGRVIEFYLNVDENYLVTACKLVTFIE